MPAASALNARSKSIYHRYCDRQTYGEVASLAASLSNTKNMRE